MANKQQVTKVEEASLPTAAPDWMKAGQGAGTDRLDTKDMEVPRIKLMQALSPEISQHNGLKPGDFWHTLAEQSLGREVLIVPIYIDKRYILWKPREAGGGILARADDGVHWNPANVTFDVPINKGKKIVKWTTKDTVDESGLADWGSYDRDDPNSQPAATLMYTFVVAMPDYPDLAFAQLTLQRSSVKVARNIIGKIKLNPKPSYGRVFRMSSIEDSSPVGEFNNFRFTAEGYVQDQTAFDTYESLYKVFAKTGLNIKDIDSLQDDETGGNAASVNTKVGGKDI